MPDDTTILGLPLILASQAQKHVTHNEALAMLDVAVQLAVINRDQTVPPALAVPGDRHIVAAGGTVDWAGQDGKVALMTATGWQFTAPLPGWRAHVLAEGETVVFNGLAWVGPSEGAAEFARLGVSATPDVTNRLSVSSPAVLLNHAGAGHQLKINKSAAGDTASLLFQTGFSGRAEMGTAGSDDFSVKVSGDGAAWNTAFTAAAGSGEVTLPQPLHLGGQAADPASPANGTLWLNTTTGEVRLRSAGASVTLGAGGVLGPADFWSVARFGSSSATVGLFAGTAISSGSNSTAIPAAALNGLNPFGTFLRSSATANSGYRYVTAAASDYFGVASRKFRAKCLWRATASNTVRIGFHNATNSADSNNGAYFEILADQVSAKTAANSVRTTHGTVYTLTADRHYTFDIEVDAAASAARFRVYENANAAPVMDVSITTNLPVSSANAFGAGVVATNSTTTASDLIILYEMGLGTVAAWRRAAG
jgi:hypothetical protein